MSTKKNLFYPHVEPDENVDLALDQMLAKKEYSGLLLQDSTLPNMKKIMVAWAMQPVFRTLDSYMTNEITKGGHAKGRSVASTGKTEDTVAEEPKDEFYIRPNGVFYYHRPWGAKYNDVEVLRLCRENNQFPFLYGPPGTGKTAMIEAAFGEELITIPGTGDTEVADFIGGYVPNAEGSYDWVDGPLIIAMEQGRPLLVDEVGLIDPKVLSILYGAMDGRGEIEITANPQKSVVKAAEGFFVLGATNPRAPGVRMSEALLSRFTVQVEVLTDYTMAKTKLNINKLIVEAALSLDREYRKGSMEWAPQLRELLAFRDVEEIFGQKFAIENLIASAPVLERDKVASALSKGPLGQKFKPAVLASSGS